ncbi:MAG: hypothetical protein QOF01_1977 [Thermomicrobiales bacterium]|jgi:hypothetical protein|nr:hypothetical protein [Thermomicrobiales bacterium]
MTDAFDRRRDGSSFVTNDEGHLSVSCHPSVPNGT